MFRFSLQKRIKKGNTSGLDLTTFMKIKQRKYFFILPTGLIKYNLALKSCKLDKIYGFLIAKFNEYVSMFLIEGYSIGENSKSRIKGDIGWMLK